MTKPRTLSLEPGEDIPDFPRFFELDELGPELPTEARVRFTIITQWICRKHGVTRVELFSHRKQQYLIDARHELAGLARRHTMLSFPEIGRRMGDRDHTTVLNGVRKFEALVAKGKIVPWQGN